MSRFDREDSAGYLVNHVARLFAQALSSRLAPKGVVPGQFPVLLALWEQNGLTQTELAERLAIEQPTMANTLKRMERDGLVRRIPDPGDGRRALVQLTRKARALEATLTGFAREVNGVALSQLSPAERELLISVLTRMRAALAADVNGDDVEG